MIRATLRRPLALLLTLCATLALGACGVVSLGYPRLPDLGLLWAQRQVSLSDAQTDRLRQDLLDLLAWHRSTQLLPTADRLRHWQTLASGELSAAQVCREADAVRGLLDAMVPQALPALVRLAQSLSAEQRQALEAAQRRSLDEFREAHLGARPSRSWLPSARAHTAAGPEATAPTPTPAAAAAARAASLEKRFDTAAGRHEMLYGALNPAQR